MDSNYSIEKIIDEYYDRVYRFMVVHIKNADLASDLAQNVFLELTKTKTLLESIDNFDAYIFSIARNALFKEFRKIKNSTDLKAQLLKSMKDTTVQCEELVLVRDLRSNFEQEINNLPSQQRKVFYLSRHEGLTHQQIAQKLGISANTVKNHMVQALKTLRGKYELMIWLFLLLSHF